MTRATRRIDGKPETDADRKFFDLRESGYTGPIDQDGNAVTAGPKVRIVDGRRETWIVVCGMPGVVCAEPDPSGPDGVCGMPVESEPCSIHHPDA